MTGRTNLTGGGNVVKKIQRGIYFKNDSNYVLVSIPIETLDPSCSLLYLKAHSQYSDFHELTLNSNSITFKTYAVGTFFFEVYEFNKNAVKQKISAKSFTYWEDGGYFTKTFIGSFNPAKSIISEHSVGHGLKTIRIDGSYIVMKAFTGEKPTLSQIQVLEFK